jgi:hypothetical protein
MGIEHVDAWSGAVPVDFLVASLFFFIDDRREEEDMVKIWEALILD